MRRPSCPSHLLGPTAAPTICTTIFGIIEHLEYLFKEISRMSSTLLSILQRGGHAFFLFRHWHGDDLMRWREWWHECPALILQPQFDPELDLKLSNYRLLNYLITIHLSCIETINKKGPILVFCSIANSSWEWFLKKNIKYFSPWIPAPHTHG